MRQKLESEIIDAVTDRIMAVLAQHNTKTILIGKSDLQNWGCTSDLHRYIACGVGFSRFMSIVITETYIILGASTPADKYQLENKGMTKMAIARVPPKGSHERQAEAAALVQATSHVWMNDVRVPLDHPQSIQFIEITAKIVIKLMRSFIQSNDDGFIYYRDPEDERVNLLMRAATMIVGMIKHPFTFNLTNVGN